MDYQLPAELIAHVPPAKRSDSRLMVVERRTGSIRDCRFPDLVELLAPSDLLVVNDTRVFPARLVAKKPTGGRVEVLVLSLDRNPAPALFRS
ncbi:MAG: tRNA preQ1(34) S-adenosylmethionine ribosyltransferase-isomerase QueA, partial [Myxococcales bacterium]